MTITLPDAGVIHVWRLTTDDHELGALAAILSDDERDRAARFMFSRARTEFIVVRGALRRLLGAYAAERPERVRFAYGAQGKPALAPGTTRLRLEFSVSHSHGQALLAFATDRQVGVDVEWHNLRTDIHELSRTCFSAGEQWALTTADAGDQRAVFYRLWSCKEAYIKARGGGLSIPLRDFSVDAKPGAVRWNVRTALHSERFTVQPVTAPTEYSAAVAAQGQDWRRDILDYRA